MLKTAALLAVLAVALPPAKGDTEQIIQRGTTLREKLGRMDAGGLESAKGWVQLVRVCADPGPKARRFLDELEAEIDAHAACRKAVVRRAD